MANESKTGIKTIVGRLVLAALVAAVAVAAAQTQVQPPSATTALASAESESQPFEGTQQP